MARDCADFHQELAAPRQSSSRSIKHSRVCLTMGDCCELVADCTSVRFKRDLACGPQKSPLCFTLFRRKAERCCAPSGAATANQLGLTTQVPLRPLYLTSGRTRHLKLGAQTVELRHAPRWQLTLAERPAGAVIRALAWGGRERSRALAAQLKSKLSPETVGELSSVRGQLPTWMAEQLSAMVARG